MPRIITHVSATQTETSEFLDLRSLQLGSAQMQEQLTQLRNELVDARAQQAVALDTVAVMSLLAEGRSAIAVHVIFSNSWSWAWSAFTAPGSTATSPPTTEKKLSMLNIMIEEFGRKKNWEARAVSGM